VVGDGKTRRWFASVHFRIVGKGGMRDNFGLPAGMAELVDARDSKSRALKRRASSTLAPGTNN
jgi:hypothetical protein